MPPSDPSLEQLDQLRELNGLFLSFLRTSAVERRDLLELPESALPDLVAASARHLDAVAAFPRALFRLVLEPAAGTDPLASMHDAARYAVHLNVLHASRTVARHSVYHARLLLGLESRAIQTLRALQLADVQELALARGRVVCAFRDRGWFWRELLVETRPEARQRLALLALQPGLERDWPHARAAKIAR